MGTRPAEVWGERTYPRSSRSDRTGPGGTEAVWDAVLWLEGPSAGNRGAALRQSRRLLRPGGRFVAADLLGSPFDQEIRLLRDTDVGQLLRTCEDELCRAGFEDVRLWDVTRETWGRFYRHSREFFAAKLLLQQLDEPRHAAILNALPGGVPLRPVAVGVDGRAVPLRDVPTARPRRRGEGEPERLALGGDRRGQRREQRRQQQQRRQRDPADPASAVATE